METIDIAMTLSVIFGGIVIFVLLVAIHRGYTKTQSPARYNADELLVEDTGDVFQQGKYIYYSLNSDIMFISPTRPTFEGRHPLAQKSAYFVGEL